MRSDYAPNPERDSLLAVILANPDDDLPRTIYADWCEENGYEARAEFIRLQLSSHLLQTEKINVACGTSFSEEDEAVFLEYNHLVSRQHELLMAHGEKEWGLPCLMSGLPVGGPRAWVKHDGIYDMNSKVNGQTLIGWDWRRGFIDHVTCPWQCREYGWVKHHEAMMKVVPLREVTFMTLPEWYMSPVIVDDITTDGKSATLIYRWQVSIPGMENKIVSQALTIPHRMIQKTGTLIADYELLRRTLDRSVEESRTIPGTLKALWGPKKEGGPGITRFNLPGPIRSHARANFNSPVDYDYSPDSEEPEFYEVTNFNSRRDPQYVRGIRIPPTRRQADAD